MQKYNTTYFFILSLLLFSCTQQGTGDAKTPELVSEVRWGDQLDGTYVNPVVWADYNNPFLYQHGDDFWLIAASHHYMGMPVLHSSDMLNWKLVNRIYREIKSLHQYDVPGLAYKKGAWAPSMVCHDGWFHMYVLNSTDGLYMSRTTDPAGEWEPMKLIHEVQRWEDPSVFWDDDGQAYFLHSGKRVAPVTIHRMNTEGTEILDEGKVILSPNGHNPFIIKKNGYYYLWAAGGKDSQQMVGRASDIMGPYEVRVVLERGGIGPSPGGGGYVELPDGTSWFNHHVGIEGHGRMPFLEPVRWVDGWPQIGEDTDGNGIGEPIPGFQKPIPSQPEFSFHFHDEFDVPEIRNEWYWNHNPDPTLFNTGEGALVLHADTLYAMEGIDGSFVPVSFEEDDIRRAKNILAFMPLGVKGQAFTKMNFSDMTDGQRAGMALFNQDYYWLGIRKRNGRTLLVKYSNESKQVITALQGDNIWLRAQTDNGKGTLAWSIDGEWYEPTKDTLIFKRQWFENHKIALFTYNVEARKGKVEFDWFDYKYAPGYPVEIQK